MQTKRCMNKLKIGKEAVLVFCRMGLTDEESLWSESVTGLEKENKTRHPCL